MSRHDKLRAGLAGWAMLMLAAAGAQAASQGFAAELDPAPFDASNKAFVAGKGDVTASLEGRTLTIAGSFSDLSSPATAAHVNMGLAMGVLGNPIGDLTITHAASGTVSGKISLNPKQLAALHAKSLYVRIDSEKAPDGNLQGWLEGN